MPITGGNTKAMLKEYHARMGHGVVGAVEESLHISAASLLSHSFNIAEHTTDSTHTDTVR